MGTGSGQSLSNNTSRNRQQGQPTYKPAHSALASFRMEHRGPCPSDTSWRTNDFYGAFGMASDEFGHAAKQETPDASLSMRTNDDQIGTPLGCGIDDSLSDVTYLDGGVHLESCATQFLRNSLDQLTGWLFLVVQLGSITG